MKKLITFLLLFLLINITSEAQVTGYVFSQQNGTFTALTSETVLWSVVFDNEIATINIPTFTFNETAYTSLAISSNGFITFGTTAPSPTNYTPVSSTETYEGCISAFGQNLEQSYSGTPKISYNTNDNGDIVVQWLNMTRQSTDGDDVSFQIRLTPLTGKIRIIYGNATTTYSSTSYALQVGLRGQERADYNNRTTVADWSATTTGTNYSASCRFNNLIYPANGLTFSWESLHNPSGFQATAINFSEIDLNWNLNSSGFPVIVAYNTTTSFGTPVNGTSYIAGNVIAGGGTVIYAGSAEGFNHTGLNQGTNYYYKIWSYNSTNTYSSGLTTNGRTATALPYIQEFTSTAVPPGWSLSANMSIPSSPRHGTCGSYGLAARLNNATPVYAVSLLTGNVTSNTFLSFNYRIIDYLAYPYTATTLGTGDNIQVQISTDDGATFTTIHTINQSNHNTGLEFTSVGISLSAYTAAFIKIRFLCNWSAGDYYVDLDNIRIEEDNNMVYAGSTTEQPNTSNVAIGSTNNDILRLNVLTQKENNPLSLTSITFNTTGSTNATGDIAAAKVFYTTGPEFSTATQFGSTLSNPAGTFSITGIQELVTGNNYFWLAYDIKPTATAGNNTDAQCTQLITSESGTTKTPTTTNPAGVRKIGAGLGGTKTIPGDYATIAEAVNALNSGALGSEGITYEVAAGHTESSEAAIVLTATGSAAGPIVFHKSGTGNNPLVSRTDAGNVNTTTPGYNGDGIIIIEGSDYVTFDGIDVSASDQGIEYGYYVRKASTTNGCMNVTIKNCSITMFKGTSRYVTGFCAANNSASANNITIANPAGKHLNLTFNGNTITNTFHGIFLKGHTTFVDENFTIGTSAAGNTVQNYAGNATYEAYGIYLENISNATISYNTINNTAAGGNGFTAIGYGIFNNGAGTIPFSATHNSISLSSQGATHALYGIRNRVDGEVFIDDNMIALTNSAASSGTYSYIHNEPYSASANNISISNNTFTGEYNHTGNIYLIYNNNSQLSPATASILNNTTSGTLNRTSTTTGYFYLYYNNGAPTGTEIISGNNFSNISQAGTTYFNGIYSYTNAAHTHRIYNNIISSIENGTGPLTIIDLSVSSERYIYSNTIKNIASGGTVDVIKNGNGSTICHIYKNLITNISSSSNATTQALLNGILIGYGTEVYIYNNFISDLKTPASNSADAIRAISLTSTQANSTIGLYYNTVYLDASSSGSTFGTTAVYHVSQSNTTTAVLDLRNNILINNSIQKGSGRVVALRRSNSSLDNFALSSDHNILYAGLPGAWNNIYYSNIAYQTLEAYQAHVAPREANSFTEDTPFTNTSTSPYDLHIPDGTATLAESSAQNMTSPLTISEDFDEQPRLPSPDIGADEFTGISAFVQNPAEFSANTGSSQHNTLSFTLNSSNNDVVIVWNTNGVFTTPSGTPETGQPLANGAVAFIGNTSPFLHSGLIQGTTYYYKIFSWNGTSFSNGLTANATPGVEPATNLTATAIDQTSMNLEWTKNAAGHDVIVSASNAYMSGNPEDGIVYEVGDAITNGGTVIYKGPADNFLHTGLSAWSLYYYKCWSADEFNYYSTGTWTNAITYAHPVVNIPYLQNFDGTWSHNPEAPQDWEVIDNNGSGSFTWIKNSGLSRSLPYSVQGLGNGTCDDYLISPPIVLPDADLQLSWYDRVSTSSNTTRYKVLLSTTGKETEDFTIELGDYTCNSEDWILRTTGLNAYKGQTVHIAFYQYSTVSQYATFVIDDILVETLIPGQASLVAPINNLLTFPTDQTLSWQAPASSFELNYHVYLGPESGSQSLIYDGPLTSVAAPALDYNQSYNWKVIPENINGQATNVPGWNFRTVNATQLATSFEDAWFPPIGWTNHNWYASSNSSFHGIQAARCVTGLAQSQLITPLLSVNSGDQICFFAGTGTSTDQRIQLSYSTDKVNWTPLGSAIQIIPASWNQYIVDVSTLDGNNLYFSFGAYYEPGGSSAFVYLDHITGPEIIPLAPGHANTPSPADATDWMPVSTQLSWQPGTDGGIPTGYSVFMGTDGNGISRPTNLVNGTLVSTLSFNPPSLSENTTYYWQIVPTNTVGDAENCPIWSFSTSPEGGIQIGSEDINYDLPVNPEYSYNYSQVIYLQSEIDIPDKDITRIYYQWSGGSGGEICKDWVVYMGLTSKTSFSSKTDWLPYENMIEVFNGEVTLPETPGWVEIILDYPFPYDNTLNLVIAVDENTDDWASGIYFFGSEVTSNRSLQIYDDYSNPDPSSPGTADYLESGIANIRLILEEPAACPAPYSLEATNITDVSADLTWDSPQEIFDIEVVPATQDPTGVPTATGVSAPYTVSGLFSATDYRFYVRANCGENGYSTWRESAIFTTEICELENRCNYMVQLTDAEGDGWNGAQLVLMQNGYVANDFGAGFVDGSYYGPIYVPVCNGITSSLIVTETGSAPDEIKLEIFDTENNLIYTLGFGTEFEAGDTLFTFTSDCQGMSENEFTGLTDAYWSNPDNWSNGTIPNSNTSVVVPNPKNLIVDLPQAICRKLTIQNGGRVSIDPTKTLTVLNLLRNYSEEPGLIIRSDATGTGSLWHPNTGVKATFERYLAAADWNNPQDGWHHISSPVINAPIAYEWTPVGENDNYDFYLWDSGNATWLNQKDPVNNITIFERAVGYCVAYQQNKTQAFRGELFIGNHSSNIPITVDSWIPLGNPYPCALRWNTSWYMLDGYASIVKVWNRANMSYDDILPYGIIPATNGFMAFGEAIGTLVNLQMSIPSNARVISSVPFYKSGNLNKGIFLRVRDTENHSSQESAVLQNEVASSSFSIQCDSKFLPGYAPQFYSIKNGEKLSAYAVKDITQSQEIIFGFEKNNSNEYELQFIPEKSITGMPIYLTDLQTGTTLNLTTQPIYHFFSGSGDLINRFVLHFGQVGIDDPENNNPLPVISLTKDGLLISSAENYHQLEILDLQGRLLKKINLNHTAMRILPLQLPSGIYIIRMNGRKQVYNQKLFIR